MPKLTSAQLHTQVGRLQRSLKRERAKRQELERALKESGEQQTATSEILRVISSSPTDLTPVFGTIVANATRLCEAQLGNLFSYDGDAFHAVAHHNASPPFVDILRGPLHPGPETGLHQWLSVPRPFQIADMRVQIEASKLLTYRAAVRSEIAGVRISREASMAKVFATEACNAIAARAVQIFGGYGYSKEYAVERYYRDARVTTIYEGTSEIQRMVVSKNLLAGR